ncbi:hypothetical protein [Pseudoalteromonas sp. Z9A5]|uniref:hypothetical protein n=1 Tax=Pseudoalteromonas sp. Z9A5 TaxID=2686355 RepID=UPI001407A56E|nr:hypothetical protein [Pseudoalteromonas sp. Z9A5]
MQFNDPVEYYQAIANELNEIINEPWVSIEVEAKLFADSINLKIVFFRTDGSRESDVDEIMLPEYFYELAKVVSNEEKGLYKQCDFILNNNGKFDVNFEY